MTKPIIEIETVQVELENTDILKETVADAETALNQANMPTTPKTAETDGDESDSESKMFLSVNDNNSELSELSNFDDE